MEMELIPLITSLIIGGIAGWLAGIVMRRGSFGIIGNILVGLLGGFIGGWLSSTLGITIGSGILGMIGTAFVGAVILLIIIGFVFRRR